MSHFNPEAKAETKTKTDGPSSDPDNPNFGLRVGSKGWRFNRLSDSKKNITLTPDLMININKTGIGTPLTHQDQLPFISPMVESHGIPTPPVDLILDTTPGIRSSVRLASNIPVLEFDSPCPITHSYQRGLLLASQLGTGEGDSRLESLDMRSLSSLIEVMTEVSHTGRFSTAILGAVDSLTRILDERLDPAASLTDDGGTVHLMAPSTQRYHPLMLTNDAIDLVRAEHLENFTPQFSLLLAKKVISTTPELKSTKGYTSILSKTSKGRRAGQPLPGVYHRFLHVSGDVVTIVGKPIAASGLGTRSPSGRQLPMSKRDAPTDMEYLLDFTPQLTPNHLRSLSSSRGSRMAFSFESIPNRLDIALVKGGPSFFSDYVVHVRVDPSRGPTPPGFTKGPKNPLPPGVTLSSYRKPGVDDMPVFSIVPSGKSPNPLAKPELTKTPIRTFDKTYLQMHKERWKDSPYLTPSLSLGLDPNKHTFRSGLGLNSSLLHNVKEGTYGGNEPYPPMEQCAILALSLRPQLLSEHSCKDLNSCLFCEENTALVFHLALATLAMITPSIAAHTPDGKSCERISVVDQLTRMVPSAAKFKPVSLVEMGSDCPLLLMMNAWKSLSKPQTAPVSKVLPKLPVPQLPVLYRRLWYKGATNGFGVLDIEHGAISPAEWSLAKIIDKNRWLRESKTSGRFKGISDALREGDMGLYQQLLALRDSQAKEIDSSMEHFLRLPFLRSGTKLIYNQFTPLGTPKLLAAIIYVISMRSGPSFSHLYHDLIPRAASRSFSGIMALNDASNELVALITSGSALRFTYGSFQTNDDVSGVTFPSFGMKWDSDWYLDPDNVRDSRISEILTEFPELERFSNHLIKLQSTIGTNDLARLELATQIDSILVVLRRVGTPFGYNLLPVGSVNFKFCTPVYRFIAGVPDPHPRCIAYIRDVISPVCPGEVTPATAESIMNKKSSGTDRITYTCTSATIKHGDRKVTAPFTQKTNRKITELLDLGFRFFMRPENWMPESVLMPGSLASRSSVNAKRRMAFLILIFHSLVTKCLADALEKQTDWGIVCSSYEHKSLPLEKVRMLLTDSTSMASDGSAFDTFARSVNKSMADVLNDKITRGGSWGSMGLNSLEIARHMYSLLAHRAMAFELQDGDSDKFGFTFDGNVSGSFMTVAHNQLVQKSIVNTFIELDARLMRATPEELKTGSWILELYPGAWSTVLKPPTMRFTPSNQMLSPGLHPSLHFAWGDDSIENVNSAPSKLEREFSARNQDLMRLSFLLNGMSVKSSAVAVTRYSGNYLQYFKSLRLTRRARTTASEDHSPTHGVFALPAVITNTAAVQADGRGADRLYQLFTALIPRRCRVADQSKSGGFSRYSLDPVTASRVGVFYPLPWSRVWVDRLLGRSYLAKATSYYNIEQDSFSFKGTLRGTAVVAGRNVPNFVPGSVSNPGGTDYVEMSRAQSASLALSSLPPQVRESLTSLQDHHSYFNLRANKIRSVIAERMSPRDIAKVETSDGPRRTAFTVPNVFNLVKKDLPPMGFLPIGRSSQLRFLGFGGSICLRNGVVDVVYLDRSLGHYPLLAHPPPQHSCETMMLCQYVFGMGTSLVKFAPVWKSVVLDGVKYSQEDFMSVLKGSDVKAITGWNFKPELLNNSLAIMGLSEAEISRMSDTVQQAIMMSKLSDDLALFAQQIVEVMCGQAIARTVFNELSSKGFIQPSAFDSPYLHPISILIVHVIQATLGTLLCDMYMQCSTLLRDGTRQPVPLDQYLKGTRILAPIPVFSLGE